MKHFLPSEAGEKFPFYKETTPREQELVL